MTEEPKYQTFHSIKCVCTGGIDSFDGYINNEYGWGRYATTGPGVSHRFEKIGSDAFENREDAVRAGIKRLETRMAALTKQRAKMEALVVQLRKELKA